MTAPVEVLCFPEAETPPELRRQVVELQDEAWPPEPGTVSTGETTHDPLLSPQTMLLVEAGRVLAVLDILTTTIEHAGHALVAGGLSTVVTRRSEQGRGHGHRLVAAAHESMSRSALDLGLFTCDRPLADFYVRAGWQVVEDAVLVGGTPDDPFPSDAPGFDKVTLGDFFSRLALELAPTFLHARIALHPGTIDRLW